ncbi:MAG: TIM barrel protein [Spirochaetes bacterium]|nr:TIM barrel protein [Spirochaetota bacterium]
MNPYSVILGNLGNTCDRFLSTGYKEPLDKALMVRQAASIPGVKGIELVGTWDIDERNVLEMKKLLGDAGLRCASIIPDVFGQKKWGRGSFTSRDAAIRADAVATTKAMVDVAVELGCGLVNLWPGQDGYDYALATDYIEERSWLLSGLQEVAAYAEGKKVRLALEYKVKEPRNHSYLARAADTLLVAAQCGEHVGITIDTGHAFMAGENVAEMIALLSLSGNRLFHLHCNDNHGAWDDDMIAGSVRLVEYFEMLYWLRRTGYAGWYSIDQYPYREDGHGAVEASVLFIQRLEATLDRVGLAAVEALLAKRDPIATARFVRERLLA